MQTIRSTRFPEIGETITNVHGKTRSSDGTFTNMAKVARNLSMREVLEMRSRGCTMIGHCLTADEIKRFTALPGLTAQYGAMFDYCLEQGRIVINGGQLQPAYQAIRLALLDALEADEELDIASDLFIAKLTESDEDLSRYDIWLRLFDWSYQHGLTVTQCAACGHPVVWREIKAEKSGAESCGASGYWVATVDGLTWTIDDPLASSTMYTTDEIECEPDYEEL